MLCVIFCTARPPLALGLLNMSAPRMAYSKEPERRIVCRKSRNADLRIKKPLLGEEKKSNPKT